ncbi:MAG: N-acetylmuramoyl-L-alanine amidase [Ruminococcaceae bacterium]|nr:N-acetylmuramoyl-L-alanine amidase [Oscillospiraceae bacterium]
MSNSALALKHIPSPSANHWGTRKEKITKIIIHHAAAVVSAERLARLFTSESRRASATYCIGNDGEIIRCLDESITPGTSGGYETDKDAVTIEVANSKSGGDWPISDEALNSLILLCADIAKRNGLGKLEKGKSLCWHSMYEATACPGPYLLSKMDYIAAEANKINYPKGGVKVKINGINKARLTDELILYTDQKAINTNIWGSEVALDKNFTVISGPVYGKGKMAIPSGGFVLSGHGKASSWILENVKKGTKISLDAVT